MSIELVTKYDKYVDEVFSKESKKSLLTNNDFSFTGAATVKVYKISTASMTDYGRSGPANGNWSRYGAVQTLDATTENFTLTQDRSFTFAIDRLDQNETGDCLEAASALARQQRNVIIPEIDSYVYGVMTAGAGHKVLAALTGTNIYEQIVLGTEALDTALVPEEGRVLVVTPDVYRKLKANSYIMGNSDLGKEMRAQGVVDMLDGMRVIKVPASRLPAGFGFMIAHPSATVAPTKLQEYRAHENPPGISGALVEGRIVYDAFVLDNKADAIYYCMNEGILLNKYTATVQEEGTVSITATTVPADASVDWDSADDDVATVSSGTVTGVAAGKTVITASFTDAETGDTFSADCIVTVTAKPAGGGGGGAA